MRFNRSAISYSLLKLKERAKTDMPSASITPAPHTAIVVSPGVLDEKIKTKIDKTMLGYAIKSAFLYLFCNSGGVFFVIDNKQLM